MITYAVNDELKNTPNFRQSQFSRQFQSQRSHFNNSFANQSREQIINSFNSNERSSLFQRAPSLQDIQSNQTSHIKYSQSAVSQIKNSRFKSPRKKIFPEQTSKQNDQNKKKIKNFISNHLTTNSLFKQGVVDIEHMTGSFYVGQIENSHFKSIDKNQPQINSLRQNSDNSKKVKQGLGVYYFSNGDVYFGEFFNDKFENHGTYIFNNQQYFQGIFSNNQSIRGEYHYKNGNLYVGEFKNYKPNGYGKIHYRNNQFDRSKTRYFEGYFIDGLQQGNGQYFQQNKIHIQGIWNMGVLTFGKLFYLDNIQESYEGSFINNKFEGTGKYMFSSNSHYIGGFEKGMFHGRGKMIYPNGDVYEGFWSFGSRHGYGSYFYQNGDIYQGNWLNDKKQGEGLGQYKNGDIFKGRLFCDTLTGPGTYTWSNHQQSQFVGIFQNNRLGDGNIYRNGERI